MFWYIHLLFLGEKRVIYFFFFFFFSDSRAALFPSTSVYMTLHTKYFAGSQDSAQWPAGVCEWWVRDERRSPACLQRSGQRHDAGAPISPLRAQRHCASCVDDRSIRSIVRSGAVFFPFFLSFPFFVLIYVCMLFYQRSAWCRLMITFSLHTCVCVGCNVCGDGDGSAGALSCWWALQTACEKWTKRRVAVHLARQSKLRWA